MRYTEAKTLTARRDHICTNCAEKIGTAQAYVRWASFDGGKTFTNKMHPECFKSLCDDSGCQFEYMPYSGERPAAPQASAQEEVNG